MSAAELWSELQVLLHLAGGDDDKYYEEIDRRTDLYIEKEGLMRIHNTTIEAIEAAAAKVNVVVRSTKAKKDSPLRTALIPKKDSAGDGTGDDPEVTRVGVETFDRTPRRIMNITIRQDPDVMRWGQYKYVCWHGHRDFMRELFRHTPKARVRTSIADYRGQEDFEARHRSTRVVWEEGVDVKPRTCKFCGEVETFHKESEKHYDATEKYHKDRYTEISQNKWSKQMREKAAHDE